MYFADERFLALYALKLDFSAVLFNYLRVEELNCGKLIGLLRFEDRRGLARVDVPLNCPARNCVADKFLFLSFGPALVHLDALSHHHFSFHNAFTNTPSRFRAVDFGYSGLNSRGFYSCVPSCSEGV